MRLLLFACFSVTRHFKKLYGFECDFRKVCLGQGRICGILKRLRICIKFYDFCSILLLRVLKMEMAEGSAVSVSYNY